MEVSSTHQLIECEGNIWVRLDRGTAVLATPLLCDVLLVEVWTKRWCPHVICVTARISPRILYYSSFSSSSASPLSPTSLLSISPSHLHDQHSFSYSIHSLVLPWLLCGCCSHYSFLHVSLSCRMYSTSTPHLPPSPPVRFTCIFATRLHETSAPRYGTFI